MAAFLGLAMLVTIAQAEDIDTLAAAAGVDAQDLVAASDSVGVTPARYLLTTPPHAPPPPPTPVWTVWDSLALCESGGNWHINAYHDGGLQFLPSTWTAWKLPSYPPFAYQATREQQIETATRLQRAAGWGQWPTCSRRLGLR